MTIAEAIDGILSVGIEEADYARYYFRNDINAQNVIEHVSSLTGEEVLKDDLDAEMKERARRSLDRLASE